MITWDRRQWTSVNGKHKRSAHDTRNAPVFVGTCGRQRDCSIAGLHPQSVCRFAWKLVAPVSQTCVPPTSVTWLQLSRKKTNPGNSISVTADWLIYAPSIDLWHQSRHANATCAWSWRLCWINRAIRLNRNWSYYTWRKEFKT